MALTVELEKKLGDFRLEVSFTAGEGETLALLGACAVPFLRLGGQYLLYQGASLVSSAAGPGKLTKLIAMLGDAFGLVLAMTGAAAMLLLVSLISSITALSPG